MKPDEPARLDAAVAMPPPEFQALVCGPGATHLFEAAGRWLVAVLDRERMIEPGADLLDVGCGCGRVARYLLPFPLRSYTGFDRHPGMVEWCSLAFQDARFRFDFFDLRSVYSAWDHQEGSVDADRFMFPYAGSSFDSCLLASVFTHMHRDGVRHYLAELARVMRPGGKVLLLIFFSAEYRVETRDDGLNVFHDPTAFETDLRGSSFDARRVGYLFSPDGGLAAAAEAAELQFGYMQNWYVLHRH